MDQSRIHRPPYVSPAYPSGGSRMVSIVLSSGVVMASTCQVMNGLSINVTLGGSNTWDPYLVLSIQLGEDGKCRRHAGFDLRAPGYVKMATAMWKIPSLVELSF